MKKVIVDTDTCIGCGFCVHSTNGLFEFNDEGLSKPIKELVEEDNPELTVAIEGCPTGAIRVEEVQESVEEAQENTEN